jgi:hypothetical protein
MKKPRRSGAKVSIEGACRDNGKPTDTIPQSVAQRPKQTVTQIGCKPTRQGFCAATWSAIWAGSVSRTEGANGHKADKCGPYRAAALAPFSPGKHLGKDWAQIAPVSASKHKVGQ